MSFKLMEKEEVIEYIKKFVLVSKDAERALNAKVLLKNLKSGAWTAYFGFMNEFGEKYLCVGDIYKKYVWFGDESDWEGAYSFSENAFMEEMLGKIK